MGDGFTQSGEDRPMLEKTESLKTRKSLLSALSPRDFTSFGLEDFAYVKSVTVDGHQACAIHAADGTPLTVVDDRNIAFATLTQHDLHPMSVH